jgi:hypothetical protein
LGEWQEEHIARTVCQFSSTIIPLAGSIFFGAGFDAASRVSAGDPLIERRITTPTRVAPIRLKVPIGFIVFDCG